MLELIKAYKFLLKTGVSGFLKALLFTVSLFMVACTPSEKELTSEDLKGDNSKGGFAGLITAQTLSDSKIRLNWSTSTNTAVAGYHIYDVTLEPTPKLIKTVDASTTETTISGLNPAFLYKFRVRLVTNVGEEDGNTNDVPAIPYGGVISSTVISSTEVRLNYPSASSGEASDSRVYCQIGASDTWQLMSSTTDLNLSSVDIGGLVPNTSYVCRVNVVVDGKEDNNLARVNFVALGQADRIVFLTEPGNGQAGGLLTQQPIVQILDVNDNIVSGGPDSTALITLTISSNSPTSGTVSGTFALNAVAGVATFTDIFMQESGIKILEAIKEDTSSISFGTPAMNFDSASFNITSGAVSPTLSSLTIDFPPSGGVPVADGVDTYQVTFNLKDVFGNPVTGTRPEFDSNILGDFKSQPLSSTDASGQTVGSISTPISDTNTSTPRVLNISSPAGLSTIQIAAPFDPGPAKKLSFTVQPTNSPAGALGMNELKVSVQDLNGNLITSGPAASSSVSLSINNNIGGAVLSGATAKNATNGVAIFSDLGIDITANGYSLAASGGVLSPAFSNNFNITAGVPKVIDMIGPTATLSGACSAVITLQLQDFGGNPAKAIQNTTVQLSGLGNASLYSSSSCGGGALSSNVTFTPGTDTRTLYLESDKVESLTIIGTDASAILIASSYGIQVTPSKMSLAVVGAAQLKVPAGQCSTALEISPLAEDNSPGQIFTTTNITLTGILGSQAQVFSDGACTALLDASSIPLVIAAIPNEKTQIYIKDPRGETLLVNISDPGGNISTVSAPKDVIVGPSEIDMTGPSTVVSGICSQVFTVTLRDTLGNSVAASANINLTVGGLGAYPSGQFYTSPSCGGVGSNSTVIVPNASAQATVYFRGFASAVLNLQLTDSSGDMSASPVVQISVTPSAFRITAPNPTNSLTSECVGPFQVETLDGQSNVATVVDPVTANLAGAGDAGLFYSDANCDVNVLSLSYSNGDSSKDFYFKGQYPETSLTLLVSDAAAVLQSDGQAWAVIADWGWIGTASKGFDGSDDLLPFRSGYSPVAAKYDGFRGVRQIVFGPNKDFLYVADYTSHKVLKYDYTTHAYVGWMGRLLKENGIGSSGSNIPTPSPALCVGTNHGQSLPGWCTGGRSINGNYTTGGQYYPWGLAVDSTYVYVTSYHGHMISRHVAETGAFDGWIGFINTTTPTGAATGGPAGCTSAPNSSQTPGWCIGGTRKYHNTTHEGDGRLRYPTGLTTDAVYLYVASERAVLRYDKTTGAFAGWIGKVDSVFPTGGEPGCTVTGNNQITPGWCLGGRYKTGDPRNTGAVSSARDIYINGSDMYVLSTGYGGVINKYNVTTGAFVETLPNLNGTWTSPQQFAWDGSKFYVADDERILKITATGVQESWMGKVANNASMSGNPGCNSLSPNDNTPGWCLGGTHKPGLDETSFLNTYAIAYDGAGSLLAASINQPMIKKFDVATGNYQGSIGLESVSPDRWTSDRTSQAEYEGFDDNAMYNPLGSVVVGDFLYVAEYNNSRIKKIDTKTGEVVGWLGGITSVPTGGETAGCGAANAMSPAPGWCLGSTPYPTFTWNDINMIDDLSDGIMYQPYGLTSDGTWVYVVDFGLHRVQKFNIATGAYGGWIGRVGTANPTGGAPGCSSTGNNSFTPGWCFGGRSEPGNGDGNLDNPSGIVYQSGNLYVVDADNHRISSYNATTGAFNGWIGRINASPSSGCTFASNGNYNVSTSGWCVGGTSRRANYRNDRGGGFNFDYSRRAGIFSDGLHLYITNTRNIRIDKITLGGVYVEAVRTREDQYVNTWKSTPSDIAGVGNGLNCSYPMGVWGDSLYLYGVNADPCSRDGVTMSVWKMDKTTGTIVGWKGGISAAFPPLGGDVGCAGATGSTPGWCTGGRVAVGQLLGQFAGNLGMITGDNNFLYVTDREGNRMVRVPK